jgi:hypothetical protein
MPGTSVIQGKGFEKELLFDGFITDGFPATSIGFFKNARQFMFWKPVLVDNSVGAVNETVVNNANIIADSRPLSNDCENTLYNHRSPIFRTNISGRSNQTP